MHLLVVEGDGAGRGAVVRGLVSRSRIERRLSLSPDEADFASQRYLRERS
jgi:hypothetical protein